MVRDEEALWKAKGIMQRGGVTVISRVFAEKVPEYIFSIHGQDTARTRRFGINTESDLQLVKRSPTAESPLTTTKPLASLPLSFHSCKWVVRTSHS